MRHIFGIIWIEFDQLTYRCHYCLALNLSLLHHLIFKITNFCAIVFKIKLCMINKIFVLFKCCSLFSFHTEYKFGNFRLYIFNNMRLIILYNRRLQRGGHQIRDEQKRHGLYVRERVPILSERFIKRPSILALLQISREMVSIPLYYIYTLSIRSNVSFLAFFLITFSRCKARVIQSTANDGKIKFVELCMIAIEFNIFPICSFLRCRFFDSVSFLFIYPAHNHPPDFQF